MFDHRFEFRRPFDRQFTLVAPRATLPARTPTSRYKLVDLARKPISSGSRKIRKKRNGWKAVTKSEFCKNLHVWSDQRR